MRDFYERFYRLAPGSAAHQEFCRRVFGADLCQHGFADVAQLEMVIEADGLDFVHENRMGDSRGTRSAINAGLHRRYLYRVRVP